MPVQPNNLPNTAITPVNTNDLQSINNDVAVNRQRINQPWSLRVYQSIHQSFSGPINLQMGFNTVSLNTYKALNGNPYSLKFISTVISGNTYPIAGVQVPQYGLYDIYASIYSSTSTGSVGVVNQVFLLIYVNGSFVTTGPSSGITSSEDVCVGIRDTIFLNPNDIVTIHFQENYAGANFTTDAQPYDCFLNIRYLGLT